MKRGNIANQLLRLPLAVFLALIFLTNTLSAATVTWVGGSGDWNTVTNWSTGALPGVSDNVIIAPAGNVTVTHSSGTHTVNSIQSSEAFVLSGGLLAVATTFLASNTITLSGGTLQTATITTTNGSSLLVSGNSSTLGGVTINGVLDVGNTYSGVNQLIVLDGLTLNGTMLIGNPTNGNWGRVSFNNVNQTLGGTGTVVFGDSVNNWLSSYNSNPTLTIGAGIMVHGQEGNVGYGGYGTIINQGTILADVSGGTLSVQPGSFQNQGSIGALNGGQLIVQGMIGNVGQVLQGAGSGLSLSGTYTNNLALSVTNNAGLTLNGNWVNAGTINVTNSTLNLGGNGNWVNVGTINVTNSSLSLGGSMTTTNLGTINRNGGTVYLTGTLNNTNATLALNAASGSWVLAGGTIAGGVINESGGAVLFVNSSAGTLDGVTVNGMLDVGNTYSGVNQLTVLDGLTLNGTILIGNPTNGNWGRVSFNNVNQTLGGTGTVVFGDSVNNWLSSYNSNPTLTIGAGIMVHGQDGNVGYGSYGTIINQGTIVEDVSGGALYVQPGAFQNQGMISCDVSGGTVAVSAQQITNTGTLNAALGTLNLSGNYNLTGGAINVGISGLSNYGQINFAGDVALAGTFGITLNSGYQPALGNSFALINYTSENGTFSGYNLPNTGLSLQANYGNNSFTVTATQQLTPIVNITSPTNNSSYQAPVNVKITATATSQAGSITNMAFFQGGKQLGTTNSSPASVTWSNVPAGDYILTVTATDTTGVMGTSSSRVITVLPSVSGTNFTWVGSVSSDWFTAGNWSPAGVPGPFDEANVLNGGTISLSTNVTVGYLNLASGTMNGAGLLSVSNTFYWTGGSVYCPVLIQTNSQMIIAGSSQLNLYGLLTNAGTVNWGGTGSLRVYNYGPAGYTGGIVNLAGGVFNALGDQVMSIYEGGEYFNNYGLFEKSPTTGTTTIGAVFNNSGTVNVQSGTVDFNGGGNMGGTYIAAANTGLGFGGNNTGTAAIGTLANLSVYGGAVSLSGTVQNLSVSSGTLTFSGPVQNLGASGGTFNGLNSSISNLTWSGSTLEGTDTITGSASWTSGSLAGGSFLTVASNAALNLSGSSQLNLYGLLTNAGTVNWGGTGSLRVYNYGPAGYTGGIVNLAGGVFNALGDQVMSIYEGGEYFNNYGLFEKSPTTGTTTIGAVFNNSGTVNVQSGTVDFNGGGNMGGTYIAAANTGLGFGGNNTGTAAIGTLANLSVYGGAVSLSGTVQNLSVSSGTLTFSGPVQNLGASGGTFNGLNSSISNLTWSGSTLEGTDTITGSASWTSGSLAGGSFLTVASNAALNLSGSSQLNLYGLLTNAGTVNWGGTGSLRVYNYGPAGYTGGIVNLAGGVFNALGDQVMSIYEGGEYFNNYGLFEKSPTTGTTTIGAVFNNSGTVNVQSGTVSLTGNNSLNSGTLSFGINGPANYGQVAVSGSVTLGGPLSVNLNNGYEPAISNSFTLVTCGSRTGVFSSTSLPGKGLLWQLNYTNTAVNLVLLNNTAPLVSIAYLRSLLDPVNFGPTNTTSLFTTEGVVTTRTNLTSSTNTEFYIQDATAGIAVFWTGAAASNSLPPAGSLVQVTAPMAEFNGLLELAPVQTNNQEGITILGSTNLPAPQPLPFDPHVTGNPTLMVQQLQGSYLVASNVLLNLTAPSFTAGASEMLTNGISVTNLIVCYNPTNQTGGTNFLVIATNLAGETFTIYYNPYTDIVGKIKGTGPFNIYGVLGQSVANPPYTSGYQFMPTRFADIVPAAPPVITWTNPAFITYGTPLGASQLNASATFAGTNLPGTFSYSYSTGTVLNAATNFIGVAFTPNDTLHFNSATSSVSLVVSPAPLTVVANSTNRPYGAANPVFTGTFAGVVNGDNITANFTTTAGSGSAVGTYTITAGLLDPGGRLGNYVVNATNGLLTVTSVPLSVTANNVTRFYGQPNPVFGGTLLGVVNGDDITATYSCSATTSSLPGTYPIVPSLNDPGHRLGNYNVTTNNGTLTVNLTVYSVTWPAPAPIYYGTALGAGQLDASANIPGSLAFNPTNGVVLNAGTNTLTVVFTPSDTTDYSPTNLSVSLAVLPAPLNLTASNVSRFYGQTNPVLGGSLIGVTNGDGITATYATTATSSSPAGTYPIIPTLVDTNSRLVNYTVTTNNGTLTVNKLTPVITTSPVAGSIIYGQALASSSLSGGAASVSGNFAFTYPSTVPIPGNIPESVTFTPTDSTNYNTVTMNVSVTVIGLNHVVTTATSPAGLAVVAGAGTYTNGQTANFVAPASITVPPLIYTFLQYTVSSVVVSTNASFSKTFSYLDGTNLQYIADYTMMSILPQLINVSANFASPVPATTNFLLTLQFDRSMKTNPAPALLLTNSGALLQAAVGNNGYWTTNALANDTYHAPPVSLITGMDGTNQLYVSGALDLSSDVLALTNPAYFVVDATPPPAPVLSLVSSNSSSVVMGWANYVAPADLSEFRVYLEPTNFPSVAGLQVLTALGAGSRSVQVGNLALNTTYYLAVAAIDVAGNVSAINTLSVTLPSTVPPPVTVQETPVGASSALLSWAGYNTSSLLGFAGFDVFYQTTPFGSVTGLTPQATLGPGVSSYQVNGLDRTKTYYFAVVGYNVYNGFNPAVSTVSWSDPYSGTISSNTTIGSNAQTVVTIYQSIVLTNNAMLTIEPGTTLLFEPGTSLTVQQGSLQANGTVFSPIVFDSANDSTGNSPAPGNWGGVILGSGAGGSLLNFVTVQYGNGLVVSGCAPSVQAFTAEYDTQGITLQNGASLNTSNALISFDGIGVAQSDTASLTIQNSVIQNNGTNAIQKGSSQLSATSVWWGTASQAAVAASIQGNILYGPFLSYEPLLTPAAATVGNVVQTGTPSVNLELACRTANSMRISENDLFAGVFFVAYTNSATFALSSDGGLQRIYVQLSSVTGATNTPIEVDVNYVTGGPVIQSFSLTNGETLNRPLTVTASATAVLGMQDIEFYLDGIGVATNLGGGFSFYFDIRSLANGPHQAELVARDTSGNASALPNSVIVAITPPPAPVITSPPPNLLTNMDVVTISGTAEPNINLQITDNGQVLALTNAGATGNFTIANVALTEGANSLVAIASDNTGITPSPAVQVTVETIPPTVSAMNSPVYNPGLGLYLSWQLPVTGKQPTTFELFWSTSPFTSTSQATSHSIVLNQPFDNVQGLANGTYYFGVVGFDTAGNPSPLSELVSILYNTTPPALNLIYNPPSSPSGPGPLTIVLTSSEALASTPSLTIQPAGTMSPVLLSLTNVAVNTWQTAFGITPATPSGTAIFQASAQDMQGNLFQGAPSGSPLVVDTAPPTGTIATQPAGPVQTINATNVIVDLTLSETVSNGTTPSLSYQPPQGASVKVTLSGAAINWNGMLPLTPAMGSGVGQFALTAIDILGNVGTNIVVGGQLEIYNSSLPLPPAAPVNLVAESLAGGYINLTWNSVSNAQIYRLYREPGANFTLPATLAIDNIATNTVVDLPPSDGTYSYGVSASRFGSESGISNVVQAISDRTPAPAPTNVEVTLLTSGAQISWQEPSGGEIPVAYQIYRNGTVIRTVPSIVPVTDYPPRGTNTYVVASVDSFGNQNPSLPVTLQLLVSPVYNLSALVVAGLAPQLTWLSSDSTVVGFNVYRNGVVQNASPLTSATYTDNLPLSDATTYNISAVNGSHQESPQRSVTVYPVNLSLVADGNDPLLINYFDNVGVGIANLASSAALPLSQLVLNRQISGINPLIVTQVVNSTVAPAANFQQSFILPDSPIVATQTMTLSAVEQTDAADDTAVYQQTFALTNSQLPGTEINVSASQLPLAGGLNNFQVQIFNQGYADMQFIVARNYGAKPGDLYISVQNSFGQEVSRTPFEGTPPGTTFLSDGTGYVDIPAQGSLTFIVPNVLVPAALAGSMNVNFAAVVGQIYNQLETSNQVASGPLSGSMVSSSLALPPYYGTATTDRKGYDNTQPIIISGQAISQSTGLPVPNAALAIGFATRGYRWYESVTTDTNGNYHYSYSPPLGFEGSLAIWAANPLVVDQLNQAQVTVYTMYANPGGIDITMSKNGTLDFSIQLINPGDTPLTEVNLSVSAFEVSGTNEIPISTLTGTNLSGNGFTLGANQTQTINLQLAAAVNVPDNAQVQLTFTSAEGASTTVSGSVDLLPAVPIITVPNPAVGYLEVSVNQGDLQSGTITIMNNGLEDLKGVTLTPPTNSWIAVDLPVSVDGLIHLPDLGIGQSNTFAVVFTPTTNTDLAFYSDRVLIQGTNLSTPFSIGVYGLVTSTQTGNVQFSVIDILGEQVSQAQIYLRNNLTQTGVGPIYTDTNGMATVTNLEEGSWNWDISAQGCSALSGNVNVIANQTVQVSEALSRSLVTISFNVVPVPFTDEYNIQVEQTFQTHVPVPDLVMTPNYVSFPNVTPGFQATYNVTLENEGLVQVVNVAVTGTQDSLATLTPLITYIPALQPFQTVEVPFTFTWVGPNTAPSQQDLGSQLDNAMKYANCAPVDFAGAINGFIEGLSDFMVYVANGLGICQATGEPIPTVDSGSVVAVTPAQVAKAGNWACAVAGLLPDGGTATINISVDSGGLNVEPQCNSDIANAFKAGELIGCLLTKTVSAQLQNNPLPPPEEIVPAIGGGGPACLGPDTSVLLADGSKERISDVQTGDALRCGANPSDLARVDRIFSAESNSVRSISFECLATGEVGKLTSTAEHLFWVDGAGWREALDLQVGDRLLCPAGGNAIITGNQLLEEKSKVYTLWLGKNHAFFANDVLVHDLCGEILPVAEQKVGVAQ